MTYSSIAIEKSNLKNIFRNNSYQQQGIRVPLGIKHGCCPWSTARDEKPNPSWL